MKDEQIIEEKDALYLKSFSILFIMFYNFFHLLPPPALDWSNEFRFFPTVWKIAVDGFSLKESVNVFFSFVGYIGIYVFFFLSGYGLSKTQENSNDPFYAIKRIWKLERLLFLGVVAYILINKGNVNYKEILLKLTLTDNFSLFRVIKINASWWFLACLAQLYIIFFSLYKVIKKYPHCFLIIMYLYTVMAYIWILSLFRCEYIYRNCIGHIPEFCFGIYCANYEQKFSFLQNKIKCFITFLLSFIVFILAQYTMWIWVFNGLASVVLFVRAYKLFERKILEKVMIYIGKISPYIFILHITLFRSFFVEKVKDGSAFEKLFYFFVWFLIVFVVSAGVDYSKKRILSLKTSILRKRASFP